MPWATEDKENKPAVTATVQPAGVSNAPANVAVQPAAPAQHQHHYYR